MLKEEILKYMEHCVTWLGAWYANINFLNVYIGNLHSIHNKIILTRGKAHCFAFIF